MLKSARLATPADFSKPGNDGGALPDRFKWQRGLVYTARSQTPSPLLPAREYRIAASFKREVGAVEEFAGYGELYRRVVEVARARTAELSHPGERLHTWIVCHGWRSLGDTGNIACAFVTVGMACTEEGDAKPLGEAERTPAELKTPGGATLETLAQASWQAVDEIYNEFDFSEASASTAEPVMVSYGERVQTCDEIDFRLFVERAERFANSYALRHWISPGTDVFRIFRREWYCVTNPNLVVVQLYFAS